MERKEGGEIEWDEKKRRVRNRTKRKKENKIGQKERRKIK